MYKYLLFVSFLFSITVRVKAQQLNQYFDGADTAASSSLLLTFIPDDTTNIWQIGRPQKSIFDSAATLPNAMVTDTLHPYPVNDTSAFAFGMKPYHIWGIAAVQWKQKIDFDKKQDGGIIEFSIDSGATWQNVFNNPYVYNFYGYDTTNRDTLATGEYAFSGTDSVWRDLWLCFDYSYLINSDSLAIRFRLKSDGVDSSKEGWLIDNMSAHMTFIHTVKSTEKVDKLTVYPTLTSGIVNIDAEKRNEYHIIEQLTVTNAMGRRVKSFKNCPTHFWIDLSDQQDGMYYVRVKTNFQEKVFTVMLAR